MNDFSKNLFQVCSYQYMQNTETMKQTVLNIIAHQCSDASNKNTFSFSVEFKTLCPFGPGYLPDGTGKPPFINI